MSCKLFKALFSFSGSGESTLAFNQSDLLTVIQPVDENWYFGCLNDNWGFIPIKYVQEVEAKDYNLMTKSVNACIAKLQSIPERKAGKDERSALKKLLKHRESLQVEMAAATKQQQKQQQQQQKQQPKKQQQQQQPIGELNGQQLSQAAVVSVSGGSGAAVSRQLVDAVRAKTGAPHAACVQAIRSVLTILAGHLADQSEATAAALIGQLADQSARASRWVEEDEENRGARGGGGGGGSGDVVDGGLSEELTSSRDWKALDRLFSVADRLRQDWQERGGWSLHEHESDTLTELRQLAHLLANAEPSVARRRLRLDGCSGPLCLAELHTAETRPAVRLALLHCLAAACALDRAVVDALLCDSGLAGDLLRETDAHVMPHSLQLLAAAFSAGIQLPSAVLDALTESLYGRLFALLASDDEEEASLLTQPIVAFLLAANNLDESFSSAASVPVPDRPLFRALLATTSACHAFTESLLLVFNRAEDPTALLDHSPPQRDSVLKMLTDLFSHESTAAVFYSNDIHVLLDVVNRELHNASPDSVRLSPVLQLLKQCIGTARYQDSCYKSTELRRALRHLSEQDEAPESVRSQCRSLSQMLFKGVAI